MPLLQADERIGRIVGIARRPFDPREHGWTKMAYRRGDVRDPAALEEAFAGADVVVHLAFMITGTASRDTIRAINVEGTLNTFRAAAAAGARRFVYASSVAAYGFHRDNPVPLTEDWPARPAARLFYAQEKAEVERLLGDEAAAPSRARALPAAPAHRARPARGRRQGPPARAAGGDRPRPWPASCAAPRCRCPRSRRGCRSSSSTRRTWARRSCAASSPTGRRAPTTSPPTAS